MKLQHDYLERVYAGVLGKIIGVYLGRPFEGWQYRDILKTLGPIEYYVHDRLNKPLIIPDDDITGTFTFVRALEDYPQAGFDLSAEQIGKTWLNYIIENRTILWWGGVGMSSEHTAFQRLLDGIPAPHSGSIETNGRLVAEQIGAQIFIDGWAMVCPGQPDRAAELARRASSVSHDGEALHAARLIAAMEAQAFVERDLNKLLDCGVSFIPRGSIVYRLIDELRDFRAGQDDWEKAMVDVLERSYGYDRFGGNCHVVPNHGVIILALLYANDDFQRSLMIANTAGWDTDCNSGNVGCLMGIKNGLAAIDARVDWRGPVADRVILPTADGGAGISDAATLAVRIANMGRTLAGEVPIVPKDGAKFHFTLPGSTQGFVAETGDGLATAKVANRGEKLAITFDSAAADRPAHVATATFLTTATIEGSYDTLASPTIYSTQRAVARVSADASNAGKVKVRLYLSHHGAAPVRLFAPARSLAAGESAELAWTIPDTAGQPIFEVGLEIVSEHSTGTVFLDSLTWGGTPSLTLARCEQAGVMWTRAWVNGVSHAHPWDRYEQFRCVQDRGRGLMMQGTRDWTDYTVAATVEPVLATASGLAARVRGMRRYYAALLTRDAQSRRVLRLVKVLDTEKVLAEAPFEWSMGEGVKYPMRLTVCGGEITAVVEGGPSLSAVDPEPIPSGAIAFVVENGRVQGGVVTITPLT